ncbi:F-box protein At2g17036-like [Corylus avellana]|uniref:F-box protein At2g17036-like n=1 Tax=Corylus avellana TaxID=13451 RepID=UPI001E237710|nr:F-box protein At2g17036-like [Corylus avellana]
MATMSWSDLPEDLAEMILRQPTDVVNLYNYRHVCRSWRSVAGELFASSPPQLLSYKKQSRIVQRICLLNVFNGNSSVCKIPKFKTVDGQPLLPRSVYSWHRWLVMDCTTSKCSSGRDRKYHAHHICLYNPFSRARIRLPAFKLDHSLDTQKRKFVLSSEPGNPSSIALAIRDGKSLEKLMFLKPGGKEWIVVDMRMWVVDVISYKGGFCALDWHRNLIQFKLGTHVPYAKRIPTRINALSSDLYPTEYLMESLCGDLLLVQLNLGSNGGWKFNVFKLDWGRMAWKEITSLGDEAIFLSCDESGCMRAGDSTIFKRNCIYFTDDVLCMTLQKEGFGVYDIANQTVGRFPRSFPHQNDRLCYRWFTTQI